MNDDQLAAAASAYFLALGRFPGWKGKIIGAYAAGALGLPYELPAPHPGTGLDDALNGVTAEAYQAGKKFAENEKKS